MSLATRIFLTCSALGVLSLVLAATATAKPTATESITAVIPVPSFPTAPPYTQSYTGTYGSNGQFADAGTLNVQASLTAVASPKVGVLNTVLTLTSTEGNGTLTLRCTQLATPADFSTYPIVPDTGSCAVLNATGAYATLHGAGTIAGVAAFDPSGTSGTLTDTINLGG